MSELASIAVDGEDDCDDDGDNCEDGGEDSATEEKEVKVCAVSVGGEFEWRV